MAIELHIEELVLHGFPAGDRQRIAEAAQTELARLLAAGGLPKQDISLDRVNGGAFQVAANAKPQQAGRQIAQAVFRSLGQQTGSAVARRAQGGTRG
jgi:hypothetical protein